MNSIITPNDLDFIDRAIYLPDKQQRKLFQTKIDCGKIRLIIVLTIVFAFFISAGIILSRLPHLGENQRNVINGFFTMLSIFTGMAIIWNFADLAITTTTPVKKRAYDSGQYLLKDFKTSLYLGLNDPFSRLSSLYEFAWLCGREKQADQIIKDAIKLRKAAAYLNDTYKMRSLRHLTQLQIKDLYLKHLAELETELAKLVAPDISKIHQRALKLKYAGALTDDEKDQIGIDDENIIDEIQ